MYIYRKSMNRSCMGLRLWAENAPSFAVGMNAPNLTSNSVRQLADELGHHDAAERVARMAFSSADACDDITRDGSLMIAVSANRAAHWGNINDGSSISKEGGTRLASSKHPLLVVKSEVTTTVQFWESVGYQSRGSEEVNHNTTQDRRMAPAAEYLVQVCPLLVIEIRDKAGREGKTFDAVHLEYALEDAGHPGAALYSVPHVEYPEFEKRCDVEYPLEVPNTTVIGDPGFEAAKACKRKATGCSSGIVKGFHEHCALGDLNYGQFFQISLERWTLVLHDRDWKRRCRIVQFIIRKLEHAVQLQACQLRKGSQVFERHDDVPQTKTLELRGAHHLPERGYEGFPERRPSHGSRRASTITVHFKTSNVPQHAENGDDTRSFLRVHDLKR
ncbi:hypothetical protein LshimejAT787_0903980 [Lyophyllum shimeji]|uniref:Uncharacterized protein n=1 Tax=Lyophyllum shimeji TaxID=47721 RepID=A0A9P3UQ01_LYOSH|nr:hypothetical protein LshimejAT787_0903980 [Lyophyllum shimeji]